LRNCAFEGIGDQAATRAVWARGPLVLRHCPKSLITAQSLYFLERFRVWKQLGGDVWPMDAKNADALLLLEREWRMENEHGKV
jgi:hypothetical protein